MKLTSKQDLEKGIFQNNYHSKMPLRISVKKNKFEFGKGNFRQEL